MQMTDDEHDHETEAESQLDFALRVRSSLHSSHKKQIDDIYEDFPEFAELLILEMNHGGLGADPDLAQQLAINPSLLNKLIKNRMPVSIRDARMVADRIVTHLRGDRSGGGIVDGLGRIGALRDLSIEPAPPPPLVVKVVEWKVLVPSPALHEKITELVRLLDEVIVHASTTNLPPDQRALSDIERAQLIAVLETALSLLKSPMIEKGLFKKAASMVKRAAAKAVANQTEIAFSTAGSALVAAIIAFLKNL